MAKKNIAIIGFMGAGKSTVGRLVAERLGKPFIDLDVEVEREAGLSVADIFTREGEKGFRERESQALKSALSREGVVIACGGGVVTVEENVALLRERALVFCLAVSPEVALRRVEKGGRSRPLLHGDDSAARARLLMEKRRKAYADTAHEVIDTDAAAPVEIAEEIAKRWRRYG